jgi:hypothetical protein
MPLRQTIDQLPLWAFLFATAAVFLIAVEVGFRIGRRYRRSRREGDQKSQVGSVMAASLGLLAFFLAFTFGMAGSRFDDRKRLVHEEANAIGTTYLRAELLPEPHRTGIQTLLREYVEVRAGAVGGGLETVQQTIARSEELHQLLWSQTVALAEKDASPVVTGLFIQSLNEVIDLHAKRVTAGLRNRIPVTIWTTLYFVAFLSMGLMGYHAGLTGTRSLTASLALVLAFSAVMLLITDLERPEQKFFNVSQQAIIKLKTQLSPPDPQHSPRP